MQKRVKSNNATTKAKTKVKATKSTSTPVKRTSSRNLTTTRHKQFFSTPFSTSVPSMHQPTISPVQPQYPKITPHVIHSAAGFATHVGFEANDGQSNGFASTSMMMPKSMTSVTSKHSKPLSLQHPHLFQSPSAFFTSTKRMTSPHNDVVMIQNAHFFTSVTQKIKSVFSSSPPAAESQPQAQPTSSPTLSAVPRDQAGQGDGRYQLPFKSLPPVNQKHIENVMARFRTHLANRESGASSPITATDKADFIATVSPEELESLQLDQGSQHFFQLPKPTKFPPNVEAQLDSMKQSAQDAADKARASAKLVKLDKNSPEYEEMMANHHGRYHHGELSAKLEQRRAQMVKDSLDSHVLTLNPDDVDAIIAKQAHQVEELQKQFEHNPDFDMSSLGINTSAPVKEITLSQNKDGSVSFGSASNDAPKTEGGKVQVPIDGTPTAIGTVVDPRLLISFICDVCNTRNVKSIPKQSYEKGVVLIRCDCDADHLIADNLGWFDDGGPLRIDRILQEKGQEVFVASVLDTQKQVRDKMDMRLDPDDMGKDVGANHISPEMLQKINEALATAREQDERKKDQFKHFHQQDQAAQELKQKYEELGQLPRLPSGKPITGDAVEKH